MEYSMLVSITKPMIAGSLLLYVYNVTHLSNAFQKRIFAGLIFSLIGDILLMMVDKNPNFFIAGLLAFLLAQLSYITAFYLDFKKKITHNVVLLSVAVLVFGIFCISLFNYLSPGLGGVYQKEMPEDVAKRLAELRVDVKSVTYTPKEATAVIANLPNIENKFAATTIDYDLVIEVQGQTIPMAMKRTITQQGDNWMISDVASGQMGEMKDEILFNSTFTPISRNVEQMGMKIPVTYSANKVEMEVQGKPMSMDFKGAMITDGAGMDMIIAGLPLKEGYTINVEMPDMSTMKSKQVTVKVIGKEMLNNIEHTMVEVVSADNENDKITLWINPATKSATKMVQILPAMGNAKMTTTMK